jgi:hypothetical protein
MHRGAATRRRTTTTRDLRGMATRVSPATAKAPANTHFCTVHGTTSGQVDRSSLLRGLRLWPASCGDSRPIRMRESTRDERRPAVVYVYVGNKKVWIYRGFYGSDGTRTRDLRRDRPVLVVPGWAGIGGDSRPERGFLRWRCGDCRERAGGSVGFLRDLRGMTLSSDRQNEGVRTDELSVTLHSQGCLDSDVGADAVDAVPAATHVRPGAGRAR